MICSAAQGTFRALSGPCDLNPDPAFVTAPRVTASGAGLACELHLVGWRCRARILDTVSDVCQVSCRCLFAKGSTA